MKKCSYCGAEYPDETTACPIDQTPLGETSPEQISETPSRKFPIFAVFSENKVPVSLAIVSYLYFFPAAMCCAVIAFIMMFSFLGASLSGRMVLMCMVAAALAVFFVFLSRGLRRCSPGWRICALVLIWWGFLAIAFDVGHYFATHETPRHESPREFFIYYGLTIIIQIWQYRVLTRPDIKELFYGKPDYSTQFP
ncbi:MAG TPA: hypothetical protein VGN23_05190 [Verrucomicrobiae bacterium]|jgi:hypothetical protein